MNRLNQEKGQGELGNAGGPRLKRRSTGRQQATGWTVGHRGRHTSLTYQENQGKAGGQELDKGNRLGQVAMGWTKGT